MLPFTGERVVPWAAGMRQWPHVLRDHINRYAFALPYVAGRSVCDVGCGTGYGAWLMSMVAREVTGVDVSPEAIAFARWEFGKKARYEVRDVTAANLGGADVYTCFEVLEHVDDPQLILRNIPATATLIWSVPVNDPGRFHKRVYSEFDALWLVDGSIIYCQLENGGIVEMDDQYMGRAKYIIGVRKGDK